MRLYNYFDDGKRNTVGALECGRYIVLADPKTGHGLAMVDEHLTYGVRSAAAAAIACKWLAPAAPCTLGLIGVGSMAANSLRCLSRLYRFEEIRCTSRRRETREAFAAHWSAELGIPVRPVDTVEEVVRGADIAVGGTTSSEIMAREPWLKPGSLFISLARRELDPDGWKRMDKVVLDSWEMNMRMPVFSSMVENGQFSQRHDVRRDSGPGVGREARTCQRRGAHSPSYHGAGRARHRTGAPPLRQGAGDRTWNCAAGGAAAAIGSAGSFMAGEDNVLSGVLSRIAASRIKSVMVELARVPSPLTALFEAEPQLRAFIDAAVEPRLRSLGITDIRRDPMGNLAATWGRGESGRSLMLVTNAMNQPASTMPNPYGGEVRDGAAYGLPGEVVLGKGLSEQKAPLAAILVALEAIAQSGVALGGRLVFLCCVSGETGRHDAIRSIIETTGVRADMAVLNGTGNRISLGNRGRVDVTVTVHGSPCHSSRPAEGCNAITGAVEVMRRLTAKLRLPPAHPHLGPASLTVNRIRQLSRTRPTPFRRVATSASTAGCCPARRRKRRSQTSPRSPRPWTAPRIRPAARRGAWR